jgi:hypothetical protein
MREQLNLSSEFGLSERLAGLDVLTTVHAADQPENTDRFKSGPRNFGELATFLSEPVVDDALSAEQYRAMTDVEKRKRDMELGFWLPGRAIDTDSRPNQRAFMQSLFVFDLIGFEPQEIEFIRTRAFGGGFIAALMHTLRGHSAEKPKVRIIFPLFEPISLADAYLTQPELPERLSHINLAGRVIGESLLDVDRPLAIPMISQGEMFWFQAFDGAPIFADNFMEAP